MRVLLHDSHADGRTGAPGERAWVADLNSHVVTACKALSIEVVRVPGDLQDHPAFHQDYDAFVAPHYDANIYGTGGAFWGRASASLTGPRDDALGAIFWRRFRAIPGAPTDHFERLNVNVTDYYGFRLTSDKTPGILVEHGVGAPGAPDFQWLLDHVQDIADAWALALNEFGAQGEDMTPEQVRAIVADYIANTYGPALETELADRLAQNSAADVGVAVAEAVKAVGQKLVQ